MISARKASRSLRRTVFVGIVAFTVFLVQALAGLVHVSGTMRADLAEATRSFTEEQRIADRLLRAVTRQLVTASNFAAYQGDGLIAEFRSAGDEAYGEIRRYLFRDLTPEQRLELERVKEQHQRLEVTASQAFELFAAGRKAEGTASAEAMVGHAIQLHNAVDAFLQLREQDLSRLSERQADVLAYISAVVGLIALLLLIGLVFAARFLHRRLGRPIDELTAAALAMGRGDFDVRVHAPYDDEFAEVGDAFNRMADSLATAKANLEDRNRQLVDALDELKTTQTELIQSEKMSATGRMMAGLAHELNNPLASVLGYGELLSARLDDADPPDPDEIRDGFVSPLVAEAARARGLVNNLLRFSRRSGGDVSAVPLRDALDIVVGLRAYAFEQAGLRLVVGDLPDRHVSADEQRLQQVFLNIVNNAFDAMRPLGDGTLRVSAEVKESSVVVRFEDTGPGLPDPGRVFEPFYTTKGVGEGTGLGLALVHRFMEDFGGSARAANRPEGGARVELTFQAARSAASPNGRSTDHGADAQPAGSSPAGSSAAGARILVVEDEAPLRDLQRRLLERMDARVRLASAADEAIHVLEHHEIDLVISDVKMPGGSGLELFHWVESNRPGLAERFLFVTGDVEDPEIASFANAEPHRFVRKPLQMADYLERVAQMLSSRSSIAF